MSNKTGLLSKNGKLFINGEELQSGSSNINNTFNKIRVFGTSIEFGPSGSTGDCWSGYLASALGLTYGFHTSAQVSNRSWGGGGICWYGQSTPSTEKNFILAGFSCTQQEKQSAADYFVANGYMSAEEVEDAKQEGKWNVGFEQSLLGEQDVDLYIFGTYGINDRHPWMNWTDENGNKQTAYVVYDTHINDPLQDSLAFDRRTIYGAYNYVLRALYQQNPNAKVVILGQHTYQWTDTDVVNEIQRAVAEKWQIPFADWGRYFPMNKLWGKASKVHTTYAGNKQLTIYNEDAEHVRKYGAQLMGNWVADWITHTELTPLNPRWEGGSTMSLPILG